MTLIFFMGTAAELIKMFPVLNECEQRNIAWKAISSGQASADFLRQWNEFELPSEKLIELERKGSGLKSAPQALWWFARTFLLKLKKVSSLAPDSSHMIVVHGDTITTLLGSLMAKLIGRSLVHVESGLNSHSLLNPFPEEINRRICSRLADINFAPNLDAVENLKRKKIKGHIINTEFNTMFESLTLNMQNFRMPEEEYGICNIHRFENLINNDRLSTIVNIIQEASHKYKLIFFMSESTKHKLESQPRWKTFLSNPNIEFRSRAPFLTFRNYLYGCKFIITDSGSNQEECFYLGKPCLIMRNTTERTEGLNENCLISNYDIKKADEFLSHIEKFKRAPVSARIAPSKIIVDALMAGESQ